MKKYKNIVITLFFTTSIIIPNTAFASESNSNTYRSNFLSVIYNVFSIFQTDKESIINEMDSITKRNEYVSSLTTFYIDDKKISSKQMEKYQNKYKKDKNNNKCGQNHYYNGRYDDNCDDDDDDENFDSAEAWEKWYCYDEWDWRIWWN